MVETLMLEELGSTPEMVAESLLSRGFLGVRNTVRILNPIVRYAVAQTPNVLSIDLMLGDRLRIVFASREVVEVAVPEAVLQFLVAFHRGEYPNLEMPIGPG